MSKVAKVTHRYLSDTNKILKSLIPDMEKIIKDEVVLKIEKELIRLHRLPLEFWKGGNRPQESMSSKRQRFRYPKIDIEKKFTVEVVRTTVRVRIKFEVTIREGGQIHKLYYWLDRGTKSYTHQTDSAWFPPRPINRTIPNSLDVRSEPGYLEVGGEDEYISRNTRVKNGIMYKRILAGETRDGIEARNWSELIADKTNTYIQSLDGDWIFTYDLDNPF